MSERLCRALVVAEERLRALGWTGGQAFDALLPALEERLGLTQGEPPPPAIRQLAEDIPLDEHSDLLGLAYERFFADLFKGLRGQFFTPEPIGRLLVSRLQIVAGERVLDPTCGSGGLLIHAVRKGAVVRGIELDPRLARLARLNLALTGAAARVDCADLFRSEADPVDVLIANPPFSVGIDDPIVLERFEMSRGRERILSDELFIEAIERWVRPGGRAGLVLPYSVIVNTRFAAARERIDAAWERAGICTLPEGVFRPFGGAAGRAVLLWLVRRPCPAMSCGFADLSDPGYDVRSQRYRPTRGVELQSRIEGLGFHLLPDKAWVPIGRREGVAVRTLVQPPVRVDPTPPVLLCDLADADRSTGELVPRPTVEVPSGRIAICAGDVLVARLRPNLGNVALAPATDVSLVGSPEWIALRPVDHPHLLLHLLRTPTWRRGLPVTSGQTRPRVSADDVLDSTVRWPVLRDDLGSAVETVSRRLFEVRRRARASLLRLQDAVDRFAAGEIDEDELFDEVDGIGDPRGDPAG